MSDQRFNTGNPIGSNSPLDRSDNTRNLDLAVLSDEDTFQDRLGKSRLTWAGIVKAGSGDPAIAVEAADRANEAADRAEDAEAGVEQNAEQIAQDAAQQAASAVISGVDGQVAVAESAADRAEAASDAAFVNADVYPDVATGRAAVADGEQFQVLSVDGMDVIRYRKDGASVSPEVARFPSAGSVRQPSWAGKLSGWPDPFFRHLMVGEDLSNRARWVSRSASGTPDTWSLVPNHIFNGKALRKQAGVTNAELSGPVVYLDELGAVPGDTVTLRILVIGDGAQVQFPGRLYNSAGMALGAQINANPMSLVASSSPQLMTLTVTTSTDTSYIRVYPYTMTEEKGFDVLAFWAYRGDAGDGPSWPIVSDEQFFSLRSGEAEQAVDTLRSAIDYAIVKEEEVLFDALQITLDVSNTSVNQAYTLPFRGWGEIYTPAGVAFNAIRAAYVSRHPSTPPEGMWRMLGVVIKSGVDANTAPVIAIGSIEVNPDESILEDVTILLKDPDTGEAKTLNDAELGPQYFIGMYAENEAGGPAGISAIVATQANRLGLAYYTTGDVYGPWSVASPTGGVRAGFQHLLLDNPRIGTVYKPTGQFKTDVGGATPNEVKPLAWSPPKVYLTEGVEGSVYLDNLLADDADDYAWSMSGTAQGRFQHERWTVTPSGEINPVTVTILAINKVSGDIIHEFPMTAASAAANAGAGSTLRVQLIGDSFANAGVMTQTLLDNAQSDVMGVELIGTRGDGLNRHEGRGGWRIDDYATVGRTNYQFNVSGVVIEPAINSTQYSNNGATFTVQEVALTGGAGTIVCSVTGGSPSASGTLAKISGAGDASIVFSASSPVSGNPFWVGGELDYAAYLLNNGLATPDVVFIELGVNDVFGQTTDAGAKARAVGQFTHMDNLIASIKDSGVGIVALIPPAGPSGSQDAFAVSYGTAYDRWRVKRNNIIWNQELVAKYSGLEASGTYIAPAGLNWDTVNNASRAAPAPANSRSSIMVERMNNGVHPAPSGYQQIGDAMWAFLKCTA